MSVGRWGLLKESSCLFTVKCYLEHFVPIHFVTCRCHFIVDISCTLYALCDICGMSCYLAGDNALLNVVNVRKSEMLGRGNIAEEVCTACCGYCSTDSRCDMVIARGDICYQRSKYIERRTISFIAI